MRARSKVDSKVDELAKVGLLPLPRSSRVTQGGRPERRVESWSQAR